MAESVVQPVLRPALEVVPVVEMPPEDEPEVRVLGQSEDPERVPHGGAPGSNRSDQEEEEEVWKAQYEVGSQIQAALERAFQLHKMTDFKISSVSALPRDSSISDLICVSSAYTLHP